MRPDERLDALLTFVRADDRVCPEPLSGKSFGNHSLLEGKPLRVGNRHCPWCWRVGGGSTNQQKAERLSEHIVWAAQHGGLDAADAFLRGLTP